MKIMKDIWVLWVVRIIVCYFILKDKIVYEYELHVDHIRHNGQVITSVKEEREYSLF